MTIGAVPLTEATGNKVEIQNQLNHFNMAYPGNFLQFRRLKEEERY